MTRETNETTRETNEMTRETNEMTRETNEMTREMNKMTRETNEMNEMVKGASRFDAYLYLIQAIYMKAEAEKALGETQRQHTDPAT